MAPLHLTPCRKSLAGLKMQQGNALTFCRGIIWQCFLINALVNVLDIYNLYGNITWLMNVLDIYNLYGNITWLMNVLDIYNLYGNITWLMMRVQPPLVNM